MRLKYALLALGMIPLLGASVSAAPITPIVLEQTGVNELTGFRSVTIDTNFMTSLGCSISWTPGVFDGDHSCSVSPVEIDPPGGNLTIGARITGIPIDDYAGLGEQIVAYYHLRIVPRDQVDLLGDTYEVAVGGVGSLSFAEWPTELRDDQKFFLRQTLGDIPVVYDFGSAPAVPVPGAALLGAIGAGLVGWMRRRHTR